MQTKPVLTQTVVEQSPGNLLHSSTVLQRPLQPRDCVVVIGVHCHSGCDWEPVLPSGARDGDGGVSASSSAHNCVKMLLLPK